jgi:hypothetical protein
MMRTKTALKMLVFYGHLTRLIAREDFIECVLCFEIYFCTFWVEYLWLFELSLWWQQLWISWCFLILWILVEQMFWVVTPCGLVGVCHCSMFRRNVWPPSSRKHWQSPTRLHGVTTQKTISTSSLLWELQILDRKADGHILNSSDFL